eukprot:GEMP01017971.1.p1 GENE.GEMP01017971.1~~GEMP01017971.1.p1  ORF type:complete len:438 (+),score=111.44 GEMP01017971.1:97-1410(+)
MSSPAIAVYFDDWFHAVKLGYQVSEEDVDNRFRSALKEFKPTLEDALNHVWSLVSAGKPNPLKYKEANTYIITLLNPKVEVQIHQHENAVDWVVKKLDWKRVHSTLSQFLEWVAKLPTIAAKHPKGGLTLVGTKVLEDFAAKHADEGKVVEYSSDSSSSENENSKSDSIRPARAPAKAKAPSTELPTRPPEQEYMTLVTEYNTLYPHQMEPTNKRRMQDIQVRLQELSRMAPEIPQLYQHQVIALQQQQYLNAMNWANAASTFQRPQMPVPPMPSASSYVPPPPTAPVSSKAAPLKSVPPAVPDKNAPVRKGRQDKRDSGTNSPRSLSRSDEETDRKRGRSRRKDRRSKSRKRARSRRRSRSADNSKEVRMVDTVTRSPETPTRPPDTAMRAPVMSKAGAQKRPSPPKAKPKPEVKQDDKPKKKKEKLKMQFDDNDF